MTAKRRVGMGRTTLLAVTLVVLGGCATMVDNYGYVPTTLQLEDISVGQDTQQTVAEKVGAPPLDDFRRDNVWYYVASRYETFGPYAPKETERQVVVIRFSDGGSVSNVERYGLEGGQVVTLSRRITEQAVPDIGFLRGLFQNTSLRPTLGSGETL